MLGTRLTSEAGETCRPIAPRVDAIVAEALLERAQRTAGKASLVIDGVNTTATLTHPWVFF